MAATELDLAHGAMVAGGEGEARRFWQVLADTPLFLLLEGEAAGGVLAPRLFDLSEGPVVLAFDREERLAGFDSAPQDYAELPGRVIAAELAGQGIGLGLNLGTGAASEALFPPEALVWLTDMLQAGAEPGEARLAGLGPVADGAVAAVVRGVVQASPGLAARARLMAARYDGGRTGHLVWVEGAEAGAEAALAVAFAQALTLAGLEGADLAVVFDLPGAARRAEALELGQVSDFPPAPVAETATLRAITPPGSDPDRPPRLR